jgi:pilus assembly protein Flp/PilA
MTLVAPPQADHCGSGKSRRSNRQSPTLTIALQTEWKYNVITQAALARSDPYLSLEGRNTLMLTFKNNPGQGLVEYALILVLVAIVVIVILALLGPAIGNVFSSLISQI